MNKPITICIHGLFIVGFMLFCFVEVNSHARPVLTPARLSVAMSTVSNVSTNIPMQVAGLISWKASDQVADATNGIVLGTWVDLQNTNFNWTQATASKKPTFYTNQQGGKPLVFFDSVDDTMASSTQTINRVRTIFVVGKRAGTGLALFIDQGVNLSTVYTALNNLYIYSGVNGNVITTSLIPTNACSEIEAVFSGTLTAAYTNGVLCSGSVANGYTGVGTGVVYSGYAAYSSWLGEYLIYEGVVSASDRTIIRNYLRTKWSLP